MRPTLPRAPVSRLCDTCPSATIRRHASATHRGGTGWAQVGGARSSHDRRPAPPATARPQQPTPVSRTLPARRADPSPALDAGRRAAARPARAGSSRSASPASSSAASGARRSAPRRPGTTTRAATTAVGATAPTGAPTVVPDPTVSDQRPRGQGDGRIRRASGCRLPPGTTPDDDVHPGPAGRRGAVGRRRQHLSACQRPRRASGGVTARRPRGRARPARRRPSPSRAGHPARGRRRRTRTRRCCRRRTGRRSGSRRRAAPGRRRR